ncbi:flippase-like domain-containing protein, partial [Patescibacteria group bacterium]|nr:flippase-like domain-containing protein [Patescibacteria group bacterium]
MRIFSKTFFVSLLFAVLLLYVLFTQVWYVGVLRTAKHIDWRFTVAAFVAYLGIMAIRALRFRFLLDKKLSFLDFLNIVFVHSFLSNNLPARSGEMSYVYLIKKSGRVLDGENV